MLVNVAVPPEESSFIVPSVVERGDLMIAISTSGASPALAKKIRQDIEQQYGREYGLFLDKMSNIRNRVREEVPDRQKRQAVFQAIVDSDVIDLIRQGKMHEAELRMTEIAGLKHRGEIKKWSNFLGQTSQRHLPRRRKEREGHQIKNLALNHKVQDFLRELRAFAVKVLGSISFQFYLFAAHVVI